MTASDARESTPLAPTFEYAFTLAGELRSIEIGINPTGKLIDIDYVKLKARKESRALPLMADWEGLNGRVVAGSDWATFRDGILEFNGRLTLRTEQRKGDKRTPPRTGGPDEEDDEAENGMLINVVVTGVVDVVSAYGNPKDGRSLRLAAWHREEPRPQVPIALGVHFEVAQASEPWVEQEHPQKDFEKYARLTESPFIGCGVVTFTGHLPSGVILDILRIIPGMDPGTGTSFTTERIPLEGG